MTVTPANAPKIISLVTAFYWVAAGGVWLIDVRSHNWLEKGGLWILLVLLTGLCGPGFWVMMAPAAVKAFRLRMKPFSLRKFGEILWCLSTVPAVLLCFGMFALLVYHRMAEGYR